MPDVVRAWKDPSYRAGLSAEELALIPMSPAGWVDLSDADLKAAAGMDGAIVTTFKTCTQFTFHRFHCCP